MNSSDVNLPRILFAGPTLALLPDHSAITHAGFAVRPPVRRGDIDALRGGIPGTLVLADGVFHQALSVGHSELRRAIADGWSVWGVSSIGAIRAFEMRDLGMRGFGMVYGHFLSEPDFQDDELALLHFPVHPYTGVTEPLVHLRHCVHELEEESVFTSEQAQGVIDRLKARWFGDRTISEFLATVETTCGTDARAITRDKLGTSGSWQVKAGDLLEFFVLEAWKNEAYRPEACPLPYGVHWIGSGPLAGGSRAGDGTTRRSRPFR